MPDVVNEYLRSNNIMKIRELQEAIRMLYAADATKYEKESGRNLVIRRIYEMIPSQMENKKKRIVAQELKAQGYKLFYYDNRQKGEVDFLIDDNENLGILPIEVKSGKDYSVHSALNNLLKVPDYNAVRGIVLSNERLIQEKGKILYLPVYYTMFLSF